MAPRVVEKVLTAMRFDSPRTIVQGAGARHELANLLHGAQRPLIITDAWLATTGQVPQLNNAAVFSGVQPDPTEANVTSALTLAQSHNADAIIAFGGGSPIDCAKAVRHAYRQVPLIAIPTTAGTGSEATPVMVITDEIAGIKRMTRDHALLPDIAIIDHELSATMPRPLTAHVGVDTLTHGIEAYVSRKRHPLALARAARCIALTHEHLRTAWTDGSRMDAREGMAIAALEGGMAFGNSSVALVHGMSRPLGALFHIPHGLSNAVLLVEVTRFSYEAAAPYYNDIASILDLPPGLEPLLAYLTALNHDLGIPRLRDCCPSLDGVISRMAADALASGSPANNPRVPTAAEIEAIYRAAW